MLQSIDKKNKITIYLIFLFILSTTNGKFVEKRNNYFSIINLINVKGLSKNNNSKISNQLKDLLYKNILFVDKEEIRKVINKYNIIERYSIKKIYPSTININIKSTKFVARISKNDQLVGANGKLIKDKSNIEILPYIFGEFNSKDFLKFKKDIIESKFDLTKFKTLYFFPSNRWDVLTKDNILIKLPHNSSFESLNLAYKLINSVDFKSKNLIDIRINNHLIIK